MASGAPWVWLKSPAARFAGAVMVAAVVVWAATPTVNQTPQTVRVAPGAPANANGTSNAMRLEWETAVRATSYRVELRDSKGALVFSAMAARSPYLTHEGQRSQLKAGESYTWIAESLGGGGVVVGTSAPTTFTYQP